LELFRPVSWCSVDSFLEKLEYLGHEGICSGTRQITTVPSNTIIEGNLFASS
jgi:hypothetical protein